MQYSPAMQILVDEHDVILAVLDAVEAMANRAHRGAPFPQEFFEKAFDFLPTFADKCHHAKEEDRLFPVLEARGVPREDGPIGCMLREHEQGRVHVRAVREALARTAAGDTEAQGAVYRNAVAFVQLLRQHIRKENEVLFVFGDQRMTPADKEQLHRQFQCTQHSMLPPGTHEKYTALARELCATAGVPDHVPYGERYTGPFCCGHEHDRGPIAKPA